MPHRGRFVPVPGAVGALRRWASRIASLAGSRVGDGLIDLLDDVRRADSFRVTVGALIAAGSAAVVAPFTPLGVPAMVEPLLGIWGAFGVLAGFALIGGEVARVRRARRLGDWLDRRATERLHAEVRRARAEALPPERSGRGE